MELYVGYRDHWGVFVVIFDGRDLIGLARGHSERRRAFVATLK